MFHLLVMTFDRPEAARDARAAIQQLQDARQLTLEDAAVLHSDASGNVTVDNEVSRDVKIGTGVGAILGALFTFMFPLAGLVLGAGAGALVGAALDRGVDQGFVNDVKESLGPNRSALFLVVSDGNMDALRAALTRHGGTIIQTTMDDVLAQQLRDGSLG